MNTFRLPRCRFRTITALGALALVAGCAPGDGSEDGFGMGSGKGDHLSRGCEAVTSQAECTGLGCGWCASSHTCMPGDSYGPATTDAGVFGDAGPARRCDGQWTYTGGYCGDGYVNPEREACDDGNSVDGDACNNDCTLGCFSHANCPAGHACFANSCIPVADAGAPEGGDGGYSDAGYGRRDASRDASRDGQTGDAGTGSADAGSPSW